ncbi:MAG TPA: 2'-5' RNA ligase family protein [Planosporangium sp.]|jgi:2'-5' RNA ligase|nr:2'-5' RNA ligase family protein [Planosporangium sp.]
MTPLFEAGAPEVAGYIAADWRRYQALDQIVNHWNRPGWVDGRHSYHWLLTFEQASELRVLAARCQAQLQELPGLDLVPLSSLHVTLQRVGFTDQIAPAEVHAIAEAGRVRCAALTPLVLRIGPLAGSAGAVRFSVGPHAPVGHVLNAVRAAVADVRGDGTLPDSDGNFIPHVSIAYSNADAPSAPVIQRVAALRSLGSVAARIDAVRLVELRRVGHSYAWEPVARVRLGG